jgi:hypothetical protein
MEPVPSNGAPIYAASQVDSCRTAGERGPEPERAEGAGRNQSGFSRHKFLRMNTTVAVFNVRFPGSATTRLTPLRFSLLTNGSPIQLTEVRVLGSALQ